MTNERGTTASVDRISAPPITDNVAHRASLVCAAFATDAADLTMLLDTLGLTTDDE